MATLLANKLRKARDSLNARDLPEAERLAREIIGRAPRNPEALHILGVVHLTSGEGRLAAESLSKAVESDPRNAAMLEHYGIALLMAGDARQAEDTLRRAIRCGARSGQTYMRLGLALGMQDKPRDALEAFGEAVEVAPEDPEVHLNFGNALARLGEIDAALAQYSRATALRPDFIDAYFNSGNVLKDAGRLDDAVAAYRKVLELGPASVAAHNNLGIVYKGQGRLEDAIACYRRALAIDAHNAAAHSNLCSAFLEQGKLGEAAGHAERAVALQPDFVDALMNLASVRMRQGRYPEALGCYRQALEHAPGNSELQFVHAWLSLATGDFAHGWPSYRWRPTRRRGLARGLRVDETLPVNLAGKTIVLLGEQGIGDELFFLRFADALRRKGARLICESEVKIHDLVARSGLFEQVITPEAARPPHDLRVLAADVPLLLQEASQDAAEEVYPAPLRLVVLEERKVLMAKRLAACGPPPYVGITWRAGTPREAQDLTREGPVLFKEAPLESLARALSGVKGTVIVLQRNPQAGEIDRVSSELQRQAHDFSAANADLEDMLALLALLDEYVGVSNTNMHLAAGLGKSARVLVPYPPEWRWMVQGMVSPWFPGFKVYRQAADGDWAGALASLAADLRQARQ